MHETILLPSLGTVQGWPGLENRGENSVIIGQERNLSEKRNCGGLDKEGCRFPGRVPSYSCDTLLSCRAGGAWHQASLGNAGVSGIPGRMEQGFNFAVTLPFGSCSLPFSLPLQRWRRPREERRDHCLLGLL